MTLTKLSCNLVTKVCHSFGSFMLGLKLVWCVRLNCTPVSIPRSQAIAVYIVTHIAWRPAYSTHTLFRMLYAFPDVIYAVNGNEYIRQPLYNPYQARINEGMWPHITRCSYSFTHDLASNITVHRTNCFFHIILTDLYDVHPVFFFFILQCFM